MNTSNRNFTTLMLVFLVTVLVALPASARGRAVQSGGGKDTQGVIDEGTVLSVSTYGHTVTGDCNTNPNGANMTLDYSVISTAAADSAELTLVVDGAEYPIGTIASGNINDGGGWTFSDRTKTAEGSVSHFLENGVHSVQVCATQSGAEGRLPKKACSAAVSVEVLDCLSSTECSVRFFGNITTGTNPCQGNAIPIHFKGDFGSVATLEVFGPVGSGYHLNVSVNRSGDSCNYTNNDWKPSATGTYTIMVNGGTAGGGIETTVSINCN